MPETIQPINTKALQELTNLKFGNQEDCVWISLVLAHTMLTGINLGREMYPEDNIFCTTIRVGDEDKITLSALPQDSPFQSWHPMMRENEVQKGVDRFEEIYGDKLIFETTDHLPNFHKYLREQRNKATLVATKNHMVLFVNIEGNLLCLDSSLEGAPWIRQHIDFRDDYFTLNYDEVDEQKAWLKNDGTIMFGQLHYHTFGRDIATSVREKVLQPAA